MAENLMIVESPNKVAKLREILGPNWLVAASVGHIRDLPSKSSVMGVEAPEFKPKYVFTERGKEVCERLARLAASVENVYLATDPDREGEAIAWHLREVLKLKAYRRVTFDAINKAVIEKALLNARQIDEKRVRAQEARRVLDRFVGYLVSPALSVMLGERFTAGRVQSPATRLVVERERAIQVFIPTNHFGAEISFGGWLAEWKTDGYTVEDTEYVMDLSIAELAAGARNFIVTSSKEKPASKAPPSPFRSTTLMQAASIQLAFDPEHTMNLAQQLFAAGHINYHRTDSQNLDDSSIADIRAFASEKGWPLPPKPRKWASVEGAQEGHEAIRPVHLEVKEAGQTGEEKALYKLIWSRAVASQLADAEYSVITTEISATAGKHEFVYVGQGRQLTKPGWKQLTEADAAEEDGGDDESEFPGGTVPLLAVGDELTAESGRVLEKKTKAPSRYTQASLLGRLEKMGIGRPSSYAAIMENIIRRGYITEKARKLFATNSGMQLVVSLIKSKFGFINLGFTAELELQLDQVASGQATYKGVVTSVHQQLQTELRNMNASMPPAFPCSICGAGMTRRPGKTKGTFFWGCSMYQEKGCKGTAPDVAGKPGKTNTQEGVANINR